MDTTGSWKQKKHPQFIITPVVEDDEGRKITRTMRRTDRLHELPDFYYAMVPTVAHGEGVFLYRGKRVDGERTPAEYQMKDGDRIDLFLEMKPSMFLSLTLLDIEGRELTRTVRKTDRLQDLVDFHYAMVPNAMEIRCLVYCGSRETRGEQTPMDLGMVDGSKNHVHYS